MDIGWIFKFKIIFYLQPIKPVRFTILLDQPFNTAWVSHDASSGEENPPCICPFTHGVEKSLYQLWHSGKKRSVIQHFPNYYVEQKQTHRYVEGRRRAEPKTINWVVNVISVSALRLFTTGNVSTLKLSRTEIHPTSQHYWDYSPRSRRAAGAFTKHAAVPGLHN